MGSPPTLDPTPTRPPGPATAMPSPDDGELLEHLQTPAAFGGHEFGDWPVDQIANGFGGDLDARHRHDHTRLASEFAHTHPELDATRPDAEQAFDRLNPDYGVPADQRSRYGRQAVARPGGRPRPGRPGGRRTPAARTTATRSSGSPARTTGSPTPSTPPASSPPAPARPERLRPRTLTHRQHRKQGAPA